MLTSSYIKAFEHDCDCHVTKLAPL